MKDQNDLNINDKFKISSNDKSTNEKKLEEMRNLRMTTIIKEDTNSQISSN